MPVMPGGAGASQGQPLGRPTGPEVGPQAAPRRYRADQEAGGAGEGTGQPRCHCSRRLRKLQKHIEDAKAETAERAGDLEVLQEGIAQLHARLDALEQDPALGDPVETR